MAESFIMVFLGLLVVGGFFLFYFFAYASRKSYQCPNCGEQFKGMEYMNAKRCNVCGTSLSTM